MRLLADENINKLAVVRLRADGHDVFYALEDSPSASDYTLLNRATQERRTLITLDRGFNELVVRDGIPAPYGIILFRLPDEMRSESRANFIYGATVSQDQWPPGVWTVYLRHSAGGATV